MPKWVALPIIDFARIVHAFDSDGKSAFEWLRKFSEDLLFCRFDSDDPFVRELLSDAREKFRRRSKAGKLGGRPARPRKEDKQQSDVPSDFELYDFVASEGLDEFDAREWFEMCNDRGWTDRDGRPIANWKGALKRFCDAKSRKRGKEKG